MMLNIGAQMVLAKGKKDAVELGLQMAEMYDKLERELNRTKRALWLARAERAKDLQWLIGNKWVIVEQKCRAYADKFREVE